MRALIAQRGFTLVEMIIVMVITGIIGGIVAIFIQAPVAGYVDAARRAELTDAADNALQRMARDLRSAVPNSLRVSGNYLEFLPTSGGGRYRASATGGGASCAAAGDELVFGGADTCFEIIGPAMTFVAGDQIIVGSTQSDGNPPYDSTATGVRRAYAGVTGAPQAMVTLTNPDGLPTTAAQVSQRFHVVPTAQQAVTYGCANVTTNAAGDGTGTLTRYWAYGYNAAQVTPPAGGSSALLANNVSACNIAYVFGAGGSTNGLVSITLGLTRANETVKLYHEVHVSNAP
jgi:MSHA biogenesis protein MshO